MMMMRTVQMIATCVASAWTNLLIKSLVVSMPTVRNALMIGAKETQLAHFAEKYKIKEAVLTYWCNLIKLLQSKSKMTY